MNEAQKRRTHEIIYRAQAQKTLENVIYQELIANFGFEGMKGIAEPMIKRILKWLEYDVNHALMRPEELLWLAMDKDQKFGYGKPTYLCKLKVVKLKLWTQKATPDRERQDGARHVGRPLGQATRTHTRKVACSPWSMWGSSPAPPTEGWRTCCAGHIAKSTGRGPAHDGHSL